MQKTFDDYLNDPRIIDEPMGLRITHAMRFKVQEETKGMTSQEKALYYREGTKNAFNQLGLVPKYANIDTF